MASVAIGLSGPAGPVGDGNLEVTFVGTATTILRAGGFTLLTDPNFLHRGERAYLGLGLWSTRLTEPSLQPEDLPPLDAVVLSHHHGDHFDRRAAAGLDPEVPIVTEPHAAAKLRDQGFRRPVPLNTWEAATLSRGQSWVRIISMPARHAPPLLDRFIPPVMGSMLEFGRGDDETPWLQAYVTGDTLLDARLDEIARRFPDVDVCLLHLGGTRVAGVLLTMDGRQGVEALRRIRPRRAVPIHFDDYGVFHSPLADFRRRAEAADLPVELHYLDRGQTWTLEVAGRPSGQ